MSKRMNNGRMWSSFSMNLDYLSELVNDLIDRMNQKGRKVYSINFSTTQSHNKIYHFAIVWHEDDVDMDEVPGEGLAEYIGTEDIVEWADGIMGALGTEYARNVTEEEAAMARAIMEAQKRDLK